MVKQRRLGPLPDLPDPESDSDWEEDSDEEDSPGLDSVLEGEDEGSPPGQETSDSECSSSTSTAQQRQRLGSLSHAASADQLPSCWICYQEGHLHADPGGAACSICPPGEEGSLESDVLVAPCGTCSGSMLYVHRRCLSRWLSVSYSASCPNCTRPLLRPVLDTLPAGRILGALLDGLQASCDQAAAAQRRHNHYADVAAGASRPGTYPAGTFASFCVAGQIHIDLPCARLTPAEAARQIGAIVGELVSGGSSGVDSTLQGLTVTVLAPDDMLYRWGEAGLQQGVAYASFIAGPGTAAGGAGGGGHGGGGGDGLGIGEEQDGAAEGGPLAALQIWRRLLRRQQQGGGPQPGAQGGGAVAAAAAARGGWGLPDMSDVLGALGLEEDWDDRYLGGAGEYPSYYLQGEAQPDRARRPGGALGDGVAMMRMPELPPLPPMLGDRRNWVRQQLEAAERRQRADGGARATGGASRALVAQMHYVAAGGGGVTREMVAAAQRRSTSLQPARAAAAAQQQQQRHQSAKHYAGSNRLGGRRR